MWQNLFYCILNSDLHTKTETPFNIFIRSNLFRDGIYLCAANLWATYGAKMFTCVHIKVTINHYIGADVCCVCPFPKHHGCRPGTVVQYFEVLSNPCWLIKCQVLPFPKVASKKCVFRLIEAVSAHFSNPVLFILLPFLASILRLA